MQKNTSGFKLFAFACLIALLGLLFVNFSSLLQINAADYTTLDSNTSYQNPWRSLTTSYGSSPSSNSSNSSTQPTSDTTMNWSGYASTHGPFTAISGSWKVPTVSADSNNSVSADAAWIGIGGETSDDLIQIGTQNIVEAGQVSTGSFYEQLPNDAENISTVNVNPGDNVTASITQTSPGMWDVYIKDTSNGETFSNAVAYDSTESSAEWIEEAPSSGNNILPLDNFGSITFTGATATMGGKNVDLTQTSPQALTMDNYEGQALTNSSPISGGNSFTIDQTNATSDTPYGYTGTTGGGGGWSQRGGGWGGWSQGSYGTTGSTGSENWQSQSPDGSYYLYFSN